jgi:endonuclease/exonuclease/phosphatase family metal-dependent hydrolase
MRYGHAVNNLGFLKKDVYAYISDVFFNLIMNILTITSIAFLLAITSIYGQTLKLATYNMRFDHKADSLNPWIQRHPAIVQMIRFYDFDVFGSQELLDHQVTGLVNSLPEYAYVGVGRDDGEKKGEYSPIFYKQKKFKLLQSGTFWLSKTPDSPSKGWDAALPRICSWVQLEEMQSHFKFFVFNTHFDHIGVEARKESAKLILTSIAKIAGNAPVILTGDFNIDQHDESYALIHDSKELEDAFTLAKVKMVPNGTFNSFDINSKTDRRIDHIFVGRSFEVIRYGILTESYQGKFPSDHFPVMIEINTTKK